MSLTVDRIVPLTYGAMRVTDEYLTDLFQLIGAAKKAGLWQGEAKPVDTADGAGGWLITIRYTDNRPTLFAHPGYWVIADHDMSVEVYDPATAGLWYHKDTAWDWKNAGPGAEPPTAAINEDGSVTVVVRQPDSLNGPWTYQVQCEALNDNGVQYLDPYPTNEPVPSPIIDEKLQVLGASVSLIVKPQLAAAISYRFSVIATDGFGKTAHCAPSDPVVVSA